MTKPDYDLKVNYPYGGKHYLLMWWTHGDQNHLIVAKSKEAAEQVYASVLKEYGAEPKEFLIVDIVSPRQEVHDAYAEARLADDVSNFWRYFANLATSYKEKVGKIPPKLKQCPGFKSEYEGGLEDEYHFDCVNCVEHFCPTEGTFESVYLQHREAFEKLGGIHRKQDSRTKSRATIQDLDQPLYTITSNSGNGIVIGHELDIEWVNEKYMFFYQNPQKVDMSVINGMYSDYAKQLQKEDQEIRDKWEQGKQERENDNFAKLLMFFGWDAT